MNPARLTRLSANAWRIEPRGAMRVAVEIYASEALIRGMDEQVYQQANHRGQVAPEFLGAFRLG